MLLGYARSQGWRHINALSRMSKTFDVPKKLVIMQTFVLRHFNFCPAVWHFGKSWYFEDWKGAISCSKICFNDFNTTDILRHCANVPLLYTCRRKNVLLEVHVYKAYHSYDPHYLSEMCKKQRDEYNTRTVKPLYSTNAILQRIGYILLSNMHMEERECGVS